MQANAARLGRNVDVYSTTHIVCRPTRREAEEFYYYFAEEHADETALAYFRRERLRTAGKDTATTQRPMERAKTDRFARATGKA